MKETVAKEKKVFKVADNPEKILSCMPIGALREILFLTTGQQIKEESHEDNSNNTNDIQLHHSEAGRDL